MTEESLAVVMPAQPIIQVQPDAEAGPGVLRPEPSLEQARLADETFAQGVIESAPGEAETVAGLMALQAGVLLLHDLTAEHLRRPAEDEKKARRPGL